MLFRSWSRHLITHPRVPGSLPLPRAQTASGITFSRGMGLGCLERRADCTYSPEGQRKETSAPMSSWDLTSHCHVKNRFLSFQKEASSVILNGCGFRWLEGINSCSPPSAQEVGYQFCSSGHMQAKREKAKRDLNLWTEQDE